MVEALSGASTLDGRRMASLGSQLAPNKCWSYHGFTHPRCSMVLVYLPTKLAHKNGVNVGKYSSTMEHMGWFHPWFHRDCIGCHSLPSQDLAQKKRRCLAKETIALNTHNDLKFISLYNQ